MSLSVEERLKKEGKVIAAPAGQLAPHIEATFAGSYYKGTAGGFEAELFSVDAKIPLSWVEREDLTPAAIFIKYIAPRVMKGQYAGYTGIRFVEVIKTSELPELPLDQKLDWTAEHKDLVKIASSVGKAVYKVQLEDEKTKKVITKSVTVSVKTELYPDPISLRNAIRRCIAEPEAFDKEQENRASSEVITRKSMEEELIELGY